MREWLLVLLYVAGSVMLSIPAADDWPRIWKGEPLLGFMYTAIGGVLTGWAAILFAARNAVAYKKKRYGYAKFVTLVSFASVIWVVLAVAIGQVLGLLVLMVREDFGHAILALYLSVLVVLNSFLSLFIPASMIGISIGLLIGTLLFQVDK